MDDNCCIQYVCMRWGHSRLRCYAGAPSTTNSYHDFFNHSSSLAFSLQHQNSSIRNHKVLASHNIAACTVQCTVCINLRTCCYAVVSHSPPQPNPTWIRTKMTTRCVEKLFYGPAIFGFQRTVVFTIRRSLPSFPPKMSRNCLCGSRG